MDHKLDEKGPNDRVRDGGYKYETMAENLAVGAGRATLENIMKAWMESKGHRANILGAEYTEIGVGIASAKDGTRYITQIFARPWKD